MDSKSINIKEFLANKKTRIYVIIGAVVLIGIIFYLTCFGKCDICGRDGQFLRKITIYGRSGRICGDCYKGLEAIYSLFQ